MKLIKGKIMPVLMVTLMAVASMLGGCSADSKKNEPGSIKKAEISIIETEPSEETKLSKDPFNTPDVVEIDTNVDDSIKVGIAFPTKDLYRWKNDGELIEKNINDYGYVADLQFANNDVPTQVSQIENMINAGDEVIIVAAIDGDSLKQVCELAKDNDVTIIAYDRLIYNTDAISYYVTYDKYGIGTMQGEYIVDTFDLDNADGPFTMEIFTGDPLSNDAIPFYAGAMDVLTPYIDSGKIIVSSGEVNFSDVSTLMWSTSEAEERMDTILSDYYQDTNLDILLCSNDSTALGAINSMLNNYSGTWPVITGQDCDINNVKHIYNGFQSMSVFKDTRTLANETSSIVDKIIRGESVSVDDTWTFNNGSGIVPTCYSDPVLVDGTNYEAVLIDSGYYTKDQLGL